jgi:hypothetical protein
VPASVLLISVLLRIDFLSATALFPNNEKAPILGIAALVEVRFKPESLTASLILQMRTGPSARAAIERQ